MIKRFMLAVFAALLALPALAIDHPIEGDRLRIQDPGDPARRRFYFRAVKEAQIATGTIADPTVGGATVEVFGAGGGDGSSGVIALPASGFRPLKGGNGYYYRDHSATFGGITQLRIKRRTVGGALIISARGANWPYLVTQPQTDVTVRVTIDNRVYCARLTTLFPNRARIVVGRNNPAPPACN